MNTRRPVTISLSMAFLAALLLSVAAVAAPVDPLLADLARQRQAKAEGPVLGIERLIALEETGDPADPIVSVILRLDGALPDLGSVPGLRPGTVSGRIATARLPLSSLPWLADLAGVERIEAARRQWPLLDEAVPAGRVDQVWNGAPAYTGDGVLVGVVDSGLDWRHDDFQNADGSTRIVAIWDLYGTGTPPAGFAYGAEYDAADVEAGDVDQVDSSGHGTHVTGIAAGNGRASSGLYRGVAYESEILFAKAYDDAAGGFDESRTIDAVNYLVDKAAALDLPIAINLSLGSHFGAHDGTTAQEQLIDDLSGEGVVFCVAAGNEGEGSVHHAVPANGGTAVLAIEDFYDPNEGTGDDYVLMQAWVEEGTSISITTPGGQTLNPVAAGVGDVSYDTAHGTVLVNNEGSVDPYNGDQTIWIQLDDQLGTDLAGGEWSIRFLNGSGSAHIWKLAATMAAGFPGSDQGYSVASPGTAAGAITVAAWKTRNQWPSVAGTAGYTGTWGAVAIGDRAPFSSIGPTRDGREKPDLVTPGMAIIAAYSRDTTPVPASTLRIAGGDYIAGQGTSMASPFACGVAALLLQKNPSLTAAEIKGVLRAAAKTDAYTGTTWNAEFGAGKIDAAAALALVTGGGDIANGDLDLDGLTTVLDVVLLVNHILDPVGHPLSSEALANANVVDDVMIDVLDLVRVVAFVLGTDSPGKAAGEPARLILDEPYFADGRWWQEVEVRGAGLAGAQLALNLDGAGWRAAEVELVGEPDARIAAVSAGTRDEQLRVLVYDLDNALPVSGVRLRAPIDADEASRPSPTIAGLRAADASGARVELEVVRTAAVAGLQLGVWPNPVSSASQVSFRVPAGGSYSLGVYDLRGRRVRELRAGTAGDLGDVVAWDGLDAGGRELATGVYFVQLQSDRQVLTRKVVLAR